MMSSLTQHPRNISKLFSYSTEMHSYHLRFASFGNFFVNYSRSSHQFKSFCRSSAKLWNSIPPDLRNLPKFCFKKKLRECLRMIMLAFKQLLLISRTLNLNKHFLKLNWSVLQHTNFCNCCICHSLDFICIV